MDGLAGAELDSPFAGRLVPVRREELGVELHVSSKVVAFHDVFEILENLWLFDVVMRPGIREKVLFVPRVSVYEALGIAHGSGL